MGNRREIWWWKAEIGYKQFITIKQSRCVEQLWAINRKLRLDARGSQKVLNIRQKYDAWLHVHVLVCFPCCLKFTFMKFMNFQPCFYVCCFCISTYTPNELIEICVKNGVCKKNQNNPFLLFICIFHYVAKCWGIHETYFSVN